MLKVNNISFSYKKPSKVVLRNISFNLNAGEHLCIMGESGCGKSTLLKIMYGLMDIDEGDIYWNNIQVLGPDKYLVPGMAFFKYVAQDFDLMPFISVSENIKKFLSRFYPEEAQKRTDELLGVIQMKQFANVMVKNLSGGQQQRVAIARALAKEPELLLLDEPFGQIDNFKKNSLRRSIFKYLKKKNIACIIATHDGEDALSFADKMIVIQDNTILKEGKPSELYHKPSFKYVAALFDDVNEIEVNNEIKLLYPHQISIVISSKHKGFVTNTYCKGSYWLIEISFNDSIIFVKEGHPFKKGLEVSISF